LITNIYCVTDLKNYYIFTKHNRMALVKIIYLPNKWTCVSLWLLWSQKYQ
jgi:hypothetical protein